MLSSTDLLSILPESLLLILAIIVLIVDPFWKDERRRNLGWVTAVGCLIIFIISVLVGRPGEPVFTFGHMISFDWLGFFFKMLFIFGAGITALFLMDHEKVGQRGESYVLLLASTIGMCLMASAADLVMLYLAIETTSIPLYILAGFMLADDRSTEAGFKYMLYGAMTSAVMLYGLSLLFGMADTTNLYGLADALKAGQVPAVSVLGIIFLIIVGLGFKVSIVPFHFWAPDVYEGSPTPVAGFLSTASKAAGFAVVARLFVVAFPDLAVSWAPMLAVLAAVTMTVGNLLALPQKNLKRLLAYSSISHAGYAMIGIVAFSQLGTTSVVFYMLAYILTNLAAFGIVMAVGRVVGSDEYDAYRGLSRRSPGLALVMLIAFLSLAGMPPFGGFIAKVVVFAAGVQSGYVWLVVLGIINSVVGVYYYLNVMKYVYLYRMEGEQEANCPIALTRPYALALVVLAIGIVVVGTIFAPWFGLSTAAAMSLF
jgi:NADH-quinone oxidoreductase subunit N